ncbi:MAG TPA: cytochrome-c oxidase, cbb3-type subunit III, partial [Steroidobacteraceae bacterium]|nr:cytochrome-c oxidase, cbb3-type subunit III [Steroidobacteraceae bacterium]
EAEKKAAEDKVAAYYAPFAAMSVPQLAADGRAMSTARNLFLNNCAPCHGSDGGGAKGFPNLTDKDWQWGGDPDTVIATITGGRMAAMPAWGPVLGAQGVKEVVAYVRTLSGESADSALAAAGKTRFETICAACHGPDGKGNPMVGAPNLTDKIWLYGGDEATITETVTNGRSGQMPNFGERLSPVKIKLLAAYVTKLYGTGS